MSDYYSQHPDGEPGDGAGARSAACGAEELKGLLQRIASHIADAEVRHGSVLEDMHGRLVNLGDDTRALRQAVPSGLNDALARIESSLARPTEYDAFSAAPPHNDDSPAIGNDEPSRPSIPTITEQFDADWDRDSADALARIYEHAHDDTGLDEATASIARDANPEDFIGPSDADDDLQHAPRNDAWHDAPREAGIQSENALAILDTRFQAFEQRLGDVLDNVATRSDVEGLKLIEAHIAELVQHVSQTRTQLERLDTIEARLERVSDSISDERLEKLISESSLADTYLERLAGALASRLTQHRSGDDAGNSATVKLDELSALVEQFVSNHRQNEDNTSSALGTVQQAMVHLLDRIDALDPAHGAWQPFDTADPVDDFSTRSEGEEALARVYHHQAGDTPPATTKAKTGPAELANIAAEINEAREATHANAPELQISAASHVDTPVGENAPQPLAASREEFVAAARRAARQASNVPPQSASAPVNPRAMVGGRRKALARPLAGLMMATLVVVIAVGVGLTTYNFIKGDDAVATVAPTQSSLLRQNDTSTGEVQTPVNVIDADSERSDSVLIDDEVPPGFAQDPAPPAQSGEPPAGIMLETGSLYSTEDLARSEQRRRMAQLSTNLGAVQGGIQSIPTALIPGSADRTMAAPSTGANSAHPQTLPPAAVGPLSLRIAAANGDPSAEFEVAARLAEGRGVEQDFKQAVIWYQRSASRGFAPAQYRLGTLYERGLGVKAELGRAKAWYRSAAEKGNIKAMHNLAVLSAGSVPSDYKTAAHWFTEAADRGVRDSQFNLAVLLESGIGVQQDLKAAYGWFKIAAQSGDKEAPRRIEQLRHRLVAAEIATGEAFARNWRAKPADPLVNDVRAAGEAWKLRDNNGVAG